MAYIFGEKAGDGIKKLTYTLGAGGSEVAIPANTFILSMVVRNNQQNFNLDIGTIPNGVDIVEQEAIVANVPQSITLNQHFDQAATLYINAANDSQTEIVILTSKISFTLAPAPAT